MGIRRILSQPSLLAGIVIVLAFVVLAALAPVIAPPRNSSEPQIIPRDGYGHTPEPPGPGHPLGVMAHQEDVFYGLVWGIRPALRIGMLVVVARVVLGCLIGLVAGYLGGTVDAVLMRITDAFLAFPLIAAVIVMLSRIPRGNMTLYRLGLWVVPDTDEQTLMLALVLFGWMAYARLMRANVLAERRQEFVTAAAASGASRGRILFRHLLPNSTHGLFVLAGADVGAVVVWATAFAFIGLIGGVGSDMPADWGIMLSSARDWIIGTSGKAFQYWYTYLPVSLAVILFSAGWNLIGDGLRDATDPRLRR